MHVRQQGERDFIIIIFCYMQLLTKQKQLWGHLQRKRGFTKRRVQGKGRSVLDSGAGGREKGRDGFAAWFCIPIPNPISAANSARILAILPAFPLTLPLQNTRPRALPQHLCQDQSQSIHYSNSGSAQSHNLLSQPALNCRRSDGCEAFIQSSPSDLPGHPATTSTNPLWLIL